MKQYLLSVHHVEGEPMPDAETMQQMFKDVDALNDQLQAEGAWVFAGGLTGPEEATVVRAENGEIVTTAGPFAKSKEHLGGFWVIKTRDLDAAVAWAERATRACQGPVEVRPFQDDAAD
jgi:hypothetical protein